MDLPTTKDDLLPEHFLPTSFKICNTTWKRGAPLSTPKRQYQTPPYEGRSVYECESGSKSAVMKIKWQINATQVMRNLWAKAILKYSKSPLPDDLEGVDVAWWIEKIKSLIRASETPSDTLPALCKDEKSALSIAKEKECTSMPQLVGFQQFSQGQDGPLPGGYVVVFIMTKVPGRCLMYEWNLCDEVRREKIRNSLILAINECGSCGLKQNDTSLGNLLYDEPTNKSYIVDWEICWIGQPLEPVKNRSLALQEWGLIFYDPNNPEYPHDRVECVIDS